MGKTWEALCRADRERQEREVRQGREEREAALPPTAGSEAVQRVLEDLATIQVAVHALEDRLESELAGMNDEVRETVTKLCEQMAAQQRNASDARQAELARLEGVTERVVRGVRWGLIALGLVVVLGLVLI